ANLVQAVAAGAVSSEMARVTEGISSLPVALPEYSQGISARSAPTPAGTIREEPNDKPPTLPLPHLSDLLTELPPFDLAVVELSMQQFLDHLGQIGHQLSADGDRNEYCPWIVAGAAMGTAVAGAAAAAAYEMARGGKQPDERIETFELLENTPMRE